MSGGKSAIIGSLIVNILAITKQFREGLGGARKDLKAFSLEAAIANKGTSILKGTLAGLFAGFTAKLTIDEFARVAQGLDSVAKAAARVGISTQSLQGLKLSGLDPARIEGGLTKMVKGIADAKHEAGTAGPVIKQLGLDLDSLSKLSTERQLAAIADRMLTVKSHAEKMRIAIKLFGDAGPDFLGLLSRGSGGLRALNDEAKQLGIAFSAEELAKVEAMNDALQRMKAVFGSVGEGMVISAAPSLTQAAKDLKDAAIGLKLRGTPAGPTGGLGKYMYGLDSMVSSMTSPFYAAGRGVKNYLRNSENWWVHRDLRNGVAAGTPAANIGQSKGWTTINDINGNPMPVLDEMDDATRDARDARRARQEMLNIYKRKGFAALESGMTSVFGPTDPEERKKWKGNETLLDAAKTLKGIQDSFESLVLKFGMKAMLERPGNAAFEARRAEIKELRQKSREFRMEEADRKLEESKRAAGGDTSRSANEALLRGTAEAYRAIAENRYPKLQLDAAKQANRHLAAIERGLKVDLVGIG